VIEAVDYSDDDADNDPRDELSLEFLEEGGEILRQFYFFNASPIWRVVGAKTPS
jgi:hypothetical protein